MPFYLIHVRDRIVQRVAGRFDGVVECDSCKHRFCGLCKECLLAQRYSDIGSVTFVGLKPVAAACMRGVHKKEVFYGLEKV